MIAKKQPPKRKNGKREKSSIQKKLEDQSIRELRLPNRKKGERPVILFIDDEGYGGLDQKDFFRQLSAVVDSNFKESLTLITLNPAHEFTHTPETSIGEQLIHRIEKLCASRLDAVVLDQNMPQITGIELLKLIRSNGKTKYLPVIIVTRSLEDEKNNAIDAQALGAQRTIFAKSAEARLIYDLGMELGPARDQMMDRRWRDAAADVSKEFAIHNRMEIGALYSIIGKKIESTVADTCLIRYTSTFEDQKLYLGFGCIDLPEFEPEKVPIFSDLLKGNTVIRVSEVTKKHLGSKIPRDVIENFIGRPAMFGMLKSHITLGTVSLFRNVDSPEFREVDEYHFQSLLYQLSSHIGELKMVQHLQEKQDELLTFANKLSQNPDEDSVLKTLAAFVHKSFHGNADDLCKTTVRLLSTAYGHLTQHAHLGFDSKYTQPIELEKSKESSHAFSAMARSPCMLRIGSDSPSPFLADTRVESALNVPLISRDLLLGTINLESTDGKKYSREDATTISLFGTLAASHILSIRESKLQQDMVKLVGKLHVLTADNMIDQIITMLFSFVSYRQLLILEHIPDSPKGYRIAKGAILGESICRSKLISWQDSLDSSWKDTFLREALDSTERIIIKELSHFDDKTSEETILSYLSLPDQTGHARCQLVIKVGVSYKEPKYMFVLMFSAPKAVNKQQREVLTAFANLVTSLINEIDKVEALHGDIYIKKRQSELAEIFSGVSHTLRTRFGSIGEYLNVLEQELDKPNDNIIQIREIFSRARRELVDLNQFVKIPEKKHVDASDAWNGVANELQTYATETYPKNVITISQYKGSIPCFTDLFILQSILYYLVLNAVDHIDKENLGCAPCHIWLDMKKNGDDLVFDICNTGSSICESVKNTLFEPGQTTASTMGRGMGLTIAKQRAMDIDANLESITNVKNTVVFRLTFSCLETD